MHKPLSFRCDSVRSSERFLVARTRVVRGASFFCLTLLALASVPGPSWAAPILSAFSLARAQANGNQPNLVVNSGDNYALAHANSGLGPYAIAEANAAAGTLKAIAFNGNLDGWGGYGGEAYVYDYFTLTGPPPGTSVILGAHALLHGQLSVGPGACCGSTADVSAQLIPFGPIGIGSPPNFNDSISNIYLGAGGWSAESKSVNELLTMQLSVNAGEPFEFGYRLVAHSDGIATSDFYGTAGLGFDLPSGASIQSAGGFVQTPAVPEPTTSLTLALGLLGLAAARRGKRGSRRLRD